VISGCRTTRDTFLFYETISGYLLRFCVVVGDTQTTGLQLRNNTQSYHQRIEREQHRVRRAAATTEDRRRRRRPRRRASDDEEEEEEEEEDHTGEFQEASNVLREIICNAGKTEDHGEQEARAFIALLTDLLSVDSSSSSSSSSSRKRASTADVSAAESSDEEDAFAVIRKDFFAGVSVTDCDGLDFLHSFGGDHFIQSATAAAGAGAGGGGGTTSSSSSSTFDSHSSGKKKRRRRRTREGVDRGGGEEEINDTDDDDDEEEEEDRHDPNMASATKSEE